MIRMPNESGYAILFFGAIAAGLVPIPSSSQLTASEAQFILEDSGARAIALSADLPIERLPAGVMPIEAEEAPRMRQWRCKVPYRDSLADDPAYMVYTSGTTSRPKGVLHAQRAAWGRRPMYAGWYGLSGADRMLHTGAFNWTYTLGTGLTDPWANRRHQHHLYGREGSRAVAAPHRRSACDDLRRRAGPLPAGAEIRGPTSSGLGALRHGSSPARPCRPRCSPNGASARAHPLRGARHERAVDVRLLLAIRAAEARRRRPTAAGPGRLDHSARGRHRPAAAGRARATRRASARTRASCSAIGSARKRKLKCCGGSDSSAATSAPWTPTATSPTTAAPTTS